MKIAEFERAMTQTGQDSDFGLDSDGYIIVDGGCYWSEEDGGRFSGGALYEKTFTLREDAENYMEAKNINGKIKKHSKHWAFRMPLKTLYINLK